MAIRKKELIEGSIFSIKVEGCGYVLSQLRDDCRMDVFDNLRDEDDWKGEDLNTAEIMFTIVVAEQRLLKLFSKNVTSIVKPNQRLGCYIGLSLSEEIRASSSLPGLRLIKYEHVYNPDDVKVLIPMLEPDKHRDLIYSYEYLGMHGRSEVIRERIEKYYKEGINWDKQKSVLYPELELPPSGYKKITYEEFIQK